MHRPPLAAGSVPGSSVSARSPGPLGTAAAPARPAVAAAAAANMSMHKD